MAETRIKKRWIVVCFILLLFSGQIPSCMMVNTPKFGRIVDASTGEGLPDVVVIAVGHFRAQGLIHGSVAEYQYRIVTHTGTDGKYWIPNTWLHLRFGLPGTDAMQIWMITAFKPGYAVSGDDLTRLKDYVPASTAESPAAWWLGLVTWVEPIKMRPVELTLPQAAGYYGHIASLGRQDYVAMFQPGEIALRKTGTDYFLPKICALDPEEEVDWGSNIAPFARDRFWFDKEIDRLDPDWLKKPTAEGYTIPRHHAKNVCNALKQSWTMQ